MRLNELLPHSPSLPIDEPGYPLEKTQAGATRHTRVAGQRPEATTHAGHSPKCPALSALAIGQTHLATERMFVLAPAGAYDAQCLQSFANSHRA